MEQYIPYVMNGIGGLVLGPIISKLLGGKGGTGALAGIVGGLAGGYGMDAAGLSLLGGDNLMAHLNELLQGGIGGGILGGILGLVTRSR
ncbi:MAG: hypothetical protein GYB42_04625 [Alphaproteobacteria bacterium]|nr:hypothetical protein [Alphaproteobacteria bacterium]